MDLGKIKMETHYHLYQDHRTVKQPLLAAKQMIGLERQFFFASDSCFRLPEPSFIAGAILTYAATVMQKETIWAAVKKCW
jgi:hypothetical protein